jgi:hypothetical protein
MRPIAILAISALLSFAGCTYEHGDRAAMNGAVGVGYYDGYYDGFYGPFDDGYWGTDGAFYYSDYRDHSWHRDDGHHYRHDVATGFTHVHGRGGPVRDGMTNHP